MSLGQVCTCPSASSREAILMKGSGSSDAIPTPLTEPCEFNSCPTGSPAEGNNASNTRFNYVNSYPVTSMRYGIQTLSPKFFGGAPDIAVAGFNVGGRESHLSASGNPSDKSPLQRIWVAPSSYPEPSEQRRRLQKRASPPSPSAAPRDRRPDTPRRCRHT